MDKYQLLGRFHLFLQSNQEEFKDEALAVCPMEQQKMVHTAIVRRIREGLRLHSYEQPLDACLPTVTPEEASGTSLPSSFVYPACFTFRLLLLVPIAAALSTAEPHFWKLCESLYDHAALSSQKLIDFYNAFEALPESAQKQFRDRFQWALRKGLPCFPAS